MLAAGLLWLLGAASRPAAGVVLVPHRQREVRIDGSVEDWSRQGLVVSFADPDPRGNRVTARLAWDREALYAAFEVEDAEVFLPPSGVPATAVYQWDSIELYVDVEGRGGPHMETDDLQVIVSSSGAVAALRGDDLLETAGWRVPKRTLKLVAAEAATRRTDDGYCVELAIPWPTFGVERVSEGRRLRIDLACNDWLEDHAQLPEAVVDFETIEQLRQARGADKSGLRMDDPEHLGWQAGREVLERAYLPWSWSGSRDFGYPDTWREVRLVGSPSWRERLGEALGVGGVGLLAAALTAACAAFVVAAGRRRARRRIATLMERLQALERETAAEAAAPGRPPGNGEARAAAAAAPAGEPAHDTLSGKIDLVHVLVRRGDPLPRELCSHAIAFILRHLENPLTPAEVAAGLHVSLRTLQRAMATSLGCTPGEVITAVRMREAQRLLRVEGLLVKEVASRVGFASVSHFSRRFKGFYGVAPSETEAGRARRPGGDG